jgi:hypothetical protein
LLPFVLTWRQSVACINSSGSQVAGVARRPEDCVQRTVCQHLRIRGARGLLWWHTPNGGKRRPIEAAIMKSLGVRAGVADLILVHAGRMFALELKADGADQRLSKRSSYRTSMPQ